MEQLPFDALPALLKEIPDPPKSLYLRGSMPPESYTLLTVVGSRRLTSYGKAVCEKLVSALSGYPISIVSGLALGVDAVAHRAALKAGMHTIAVPGSGLGDRVIYPRSNFSLAKEILNSGGALLSEFDPDFRAQVWSFPKRNRIMAGMSSAVLIIEASKRSGTLITARLAMEYNREVLAVPGSILQHTSSGPHSLIRDGATPVTCAEDILEVLSIPQKENGGETALHASLTETEAKVLALLTHEPRERDSLIERLALPITEAQILISTMELKGLIKESGGRFITLH